MDMLFLKLTVTPFLMWAVSLVSRRWGSLVGGLVAGLPLTSGPISIYLAIEQGAHFASEAATGALIGLSAVLITYLIYADLIKRFAPMACCALALFIYIVIASTMYEIARELTSSFVSKCGSICLCTSVVLRIVCKPVELGTDRAQLLPRWDIIGRITASMVLVLGITTFANYLGPGISGILSPIPVIAWPLLVFAHVQLGGFAAVAAIRGAAIGSIGVIVFYLIVSNFLAEHNISVVYVSALISSALVTMAFVVILRIYKH